MTLAQLLDRVTACPLVASVQASEGSPVDDPQILLRLAQASISQGVTLLRLQGVANISTIGSATGLPVIGLIKRNYEDSDVYITPTLQEVDEVIDAGAAIVALDGTSRVRPGAVTLAELIAHSHSRGALVLADIDGLASAHASVAAGADLVSTTLGGYTPARPSTPGPDLDLLREVVQGVPIPVFAEGRFSQAWEIECALRIGAKGVIVGGALNDPVKQTRALMPYQACVGVVGAVDIGGTWLRFGRFTSDWKLIDSERTPNPGNKQKCLEWIRERVEHYGVERVGVGTGGIVDPFSGVVWTAKEYLMPDHIGIEFSQRTLGVPTFAFGDGHATAWAHANLPLFAGKRVATLAIGTGLGAGLVHHGKIWSGRNGEYPRINDLPAPGGHTYEKLLGGINLTTHPTPEQQEKAVFALHSAVDSVKNLYFPDHIVIGGSVGLSPWLQPHLVEVGATPSPFGADAGLFGAAALALFPTYFSA